MGGSQWDVAVCALAGAGDRKRLDQDTPGLVRLDDRVDHTDLQRTVDPAGDLLVLGGQPRVQRLALSGSAGAAASFLRYRMFTAADAPITATSAVGHAYTAVAPSEREFIAIYAPP